MYARRLLTVSMHMDFKSEEIGKILECPFGLYADIGLKFKFEKLVECCQDLFSAWHDGHRGRNTNQSALMLVRVSHNSQHGFVFHLREDWLEDLFLFHECGVFPYENDDRYDNCDWLRRSS